MSEPTELYEILERFAPILDDSDLSDLSRMCREYAVNVHESRLSPPLAPVLEWRENGFGKLNTRKQIAAILESSSAPKEQQNDNS